MLRCRNCGERFSEDNAEKRWAELGDSGRICGDKVAVCPYCGSDDLFEEGSYEVSVSLWAWHEECDSYKCFGDCDYCSHADEYEGEDEEEEQDYTVARADAPTVEAAPVSQGIYECFHCGVRAVVWDNDFDFEDFGYEGEGIVQVLHCANCGADIEYRIPINNEE